MLDVMSIITAAVAGLLSLNSVVFPTFSQKVVGLNSPMILLLYCLLTIVLKIFNKPVLTQKISKTIKYFFPFLAATGIAFFILEKTQYTNYVFEHLHIFPESFLYVVILFLVIITFSQKQFVNRIEKVITLFFFSSLCIFAFLQISNNDLFQNIVKEDSILEYLQFVFDLLAGYLALKISLFFKRSVKNGKTKSIIFLVLAIALFFVAFEEISWGQRIFGINTPEFIEENNVQKELNIHNLPFFQLEKTFFAYMFIGLYGAFSRMIASRIYPNKKEVEIFTPDKMLFPYFFIVFLVYFDRSFLNVNFNTLTGQTVNLLPWQEISEGYLSSGLFIFLFSSYRKAVSLFSRSRK